MLTQRIARAAVDDADRVNLMPELYCWAIHESALLLLLSTGRDAMPTPRLPMRKFSEIMRGMHTERW
jgi:hypothetical protein